MTGFDPQWIKAVCKIKYPLAFVYIMDRVAKLKRTQIILLYLI